jgi:alpha-tubulin suppressor-like RCC1 family protein
MALGGGRLVDLGAAALLLLSTAIACNAILGVQDVSLQSDAGSSGSSGGPGGDDDAVFVPPPGPPTDGGPINRPNLFQVALGDQHSCARRPTGTIACWGDATFGQLGVGPVDGGLVTTPQILGGLTDAVDLAAGRDHTCAVHGGGTVSCWGYNLDGQLGNGETANRHDQPVDVAGLTGAVSVACGGNFSCAVRAGGTVACWGNNGSGQLGTGGFDAFTTPTQVTNLDSVVSMAAGQSHACAVKNDGTVWCWGSGENGQLGNGASQTSPNPVAVDQLPAATMVSAGERSTCALTQKNAVYCWGANEVGQLGTGAPNSTPNARPIVVANLDDATAIAANGTHVCAAKKTGSVVCWGNGPRGELGAGQLPDGGFAPSAVLVNSVTAVVTVGAGGGHSCAATDKGAVFCWGANDRGQIGDGNGASGTSDPAPVAVMGFP